MKTIRNIPHLDPLCHVDSIIACAAPGSRVANFPYGEPAIEEWLRRTATEPLERRFVWQLPAGKRTSWPPSVLAAAVTHQPLFYRANAVGLIGRDHM
jgi:hypothetical protein